MDKTQAIQDLKRSVSPIKSNLIQIARELRGISSREADKLERIIARLEDWQNA